MSNFDTKLERAYLNNQLLDGLLDLRMDIKALVKLFNDRGMPLNDISLTSAIKSLKLAYVDEALKGLDQS